MVRAFSQTFGRWGVPLRPVEIKPRAEAFLTERIGPSARTTAIADLGTVLPGESRLPQADQRALAKIVGASGISTEPADRVGHARGCSLTDYLDLRSSEQVSAPDAVVRPSGEAQVLEVLKVCARRGVSVVPFGGGTSVVGGVSALAGPRVETDTADRPATPAVVALAFDNMADVLDINPTNATVTVQPGITGPTLERILGARGFTLGHLPQSWERATIGGYVATRSAGQASTGYGRSDEMVERLSIATPTGLLSFGRAPKSAAGPDLRQLFIGSEGAFGIVTEVTLRIRRLPVFEKYEGLMFPDFKSGQEAFRELAQAGLTADVMRLSDQDETRISLLMSAPGGRAGQAFDRYLKMRGVHGGCLAILGWEGSSRSAVKARRSAAWDVIKAHGGASLGGSVGGAWKAHRFEGPYLRDELLDRGYLVETLETSTYYDKVAELKAGVTEALIESLRADGFDPYVMCHVSHVYETGCSLYFTVMATQREDPRAQWSLAKRAACDAIIANAGTITHHHAVGVDHAPWLVDEIGTGGVDVLRAVKKSVDPKGIMNPGVLLS